MKTGDKTIIKAITALFLAFPRQEREGAEDGLVDVFLMAVDGIPADFVAKAVQRFIQGLVERPNLQFRPTPAELAVECRRLRDKALDHDRIAALRLPKPPKPPEPAEPESTPEQRQRAVEAWHRLRSGFVAAHDMRKSLWTRPTSEELIASRDRIAAQTGAEMWPVDISDFPEGR